MSPAVRTALRSVLFTALAIVSALLVGAVIIALSDESTRNELGELTADPGGAVRAVARVVYDSYFALFDTSLNGTGPMSRTLVEATPLLLAGLSVALAFRSGLFNIGGAGQLMMGAIAASYVGFHFELPAVVHLPLALVAGLAGGMVWGGLAGLLKAKTGAHEVIATIMLNFIALRFLDWLLSLEAFQREGRNDPLTPPVLESGRLPELPGPFAVHAGFLLAIAAAVGVWWLLERSTVGFRLRAVGTNPDAAKAAGMNVAATYLLAMALAGGLAGLAGTANVLGRPSFSVSGGFYSQIGFDAIALALVGRSKPGGVVAAALLFGALKAGSTGMQAATDTPVDIIIVIQALIIAFVAAPAIVAAIWRVKGTGTGPQQFTAGWGAS